jgi:hypothetical protein
VIRIGVEAGRNEDSMTLGSILQELVKSGLVARIDPTDAGATIKDILGETAASKPNSLANGNAVRSSLSIRSHSSSTVFLSLQMPISHTLHFGPSYYLLVSRPYSCGKNLKALCYNLSG